MATKHGDPLQLATLILLAYSLATLALVSSSPTNLRIQVNNENIQNAPYLLEAIKQVVDNENVQKSSPPPSQNTSSQFTKSLNGTTNPIPSSNVTSITSTLEPDSRSDPVPANTSVPNLTPGLNRTSAEEGDYEDDGNPNSSTREDNIEEIVDLDPEIATKLTPSSSSDDTNGMQSSLSENNSDTYSKITDMASAETTHQSAGDSRETSASSAAAGADKAAAVESPSPSAPSGSPKRKPQLPVTSSHLKKPAYGALDTDEQPVASGSSLQRDLDAVTTAEGSQKSGGGAKSLVSPSVAADVVAPERATQMVKKMPAINLPDTLEPSQIMNGVTNASAVPGIVNKEYGQQTRTRITLGGGFVRDRLPPLVNPASEAYVDNKPEKPITPLEKTKPAKTSGQSSDVIMENRELDGEESALDNNNNNNKHSGTNSQNQTKMVLGRRDSRCPKEGITTLEHPQACDKYFYCEDGLITEYSCPNGLMYGIRDTILDYCVHRWKADCGEKSVPNPISSPGCRWQYGIFNVQGSPKCSPDYYECTAGKFEVKKCPVDGQIYDDPTKQCRFAEQAGCAKEALADFTCPPDDQANTYWPFPRYFLNERALIHCVNDKPEIVRCTELERVDPEHLHCVPVATKRPDAGLASVNLETRKARKKIAH